jgi:hypothetical protein
MIEQLKCPLLENNSTLESFGFLLRQLLSPLDAPDSRERMIMLEHTYWRTDIKVIAQSFKVTDARLYYIFNRAQSKLKNRV